MCGFAGFAGPSGRALTPEAAASRMADAIRHRGPDDSGAWADREAGIALAHRRLSILDLSPAGHQPMLSGSGRTVIAFNGEIYNFADIRRALEETGHRPQWRGHSDTEVLVEAIERWGVRNALKRAAGMFALAVYDRETRVVTLARDRIGEKPLYYGTSNGVFLFGSDLAALRRHPLWHGEVDRDALAAYMRYSSVPAPRSIYLGISKLEPGMVLELPLATMQVRTSRYWSADDAAAAGVSKPFTGSAGDAVDETERLIRRALEGQMLADVPLGAMLSGGIDSSTVAALMQAMSPRPVKTFAIGFTEAGYDEAPHAAAVARHLGSDHTELYVSAADALATVPKLADVYSEPFADSSQIPTLLVSQLARRSVTVALSGDGGDEVFSGYNRYRLAASYWHRLARIPLPLRRTAARAIGLMGPAALGRVTDAASVLLPERLRPRLAAEKLHKLAGVAGLETLDDVYAALVSHWPATVMAGARTGDEIARLPDVPGLDPVRRMMLADLKGYLADDVLVKVDRAAMFHSLETRVPLLDHRLVEFAASLPVSYLHRDGVAKWPLRQVLQRYVPAALFDRPKMGFAVPIDSWLRGPLRDWAEDLLAERRLASEGYLNPKIIRAALAAHLNGTRNMQYPLWTALMFQAWLVRQRGPAS